MEKGVGDCELGNGDRGLKGEMRPESMGKGRAGTVHHVSEHWEGLTEGGGGKGMGGWEKSDKKKMVVAGTKTPNAVSSERVCGLLTCATWQLAVNNSNGKKKISSATEKRGESQNQ